MHRWRTAFSRTEKDSWNLCKNKRSAHYFTGKSSLLFFAPVYRRRISSDDEYRGFLIRDFTAAWLFRPIGLVPLRSLFVAWVETAGHRVPDRVCANNDEILNVGRLRAIACNVIVLCGNGFRRFAVVTRGFLCSVMCVMCRRWSSTRCRKWLDKHTRCSINVYYGFKQI